MGLTGKTDQKEKASSPPVRKQQSQTGRRRLLVCDTATLFLTVFRQNPEVDLLFVLFSHGLRSRLVQVVILGESLCPAAGVSGRLLDGGGGGGRGRAAFCYLSQRAADRLLILSQNWGWRLFILVSWRGGGKESNGKNRNVWREVRCGSNIMGEERRPARIWPCSAISVKEMAKDHFWGHPGLK